MPTWPGPGSANETMPRIPAAASSSKQRARNHDSAFAGARPPGDACWVWTPPSRRKRPSWSDCAIGSASGKRRLRTESRPVRRRPRQRREDPHSRPRRRVRSGERRWVAVRVVVGDDVGLGGRLVDRLDGVAAGVEAAVASMAPTMTSVRPSKAPLPRRVDLGEEVNERTLGLQPPIDGAHHATSLSGSAPERAARIAAAHRWTRPAVFRTASGSFAPHAEIYGTV